MNCLGIEVLFLPKKDTSCFFTWEKNKNANDSPKAHGAFSAHLICEGPLRRDLASLPVEMAHLWRTIFGPLKLTAKASL